MDHVAHYLDLVESYEQMARESEARSLTTDDPRWQAYHRKTAEYQQMQAEQYKLGAVAERLRCEAEKLSPFYEEVPRG